MAFFEISDYPSFLDYDFQELPKGNMLELSMNPYTGRCFLKLEKHESSTRIAFDVLREVVHACEILLRGGSTDPLRDFLYFSADGSLIQELTRAASVPCRVVKVERGNLSVVPGGCNELVS